MGAAGMVLGILAIVFIVMPFAPLDEIIAGLMAVAGLPLSIIGYRDARRRNAEAGLAIAGIVTNLIAVAMLIGWLLLAAALLISGGPVLGIGLA